MGKSQEICRKKGNRNKTVIKAKETRMGRGSNFERFLNPSRPRGHGKWHKLWKISQTPTRKPNNHHKIKDYWSRKIDCHDRTGTNEEKRRTEPPVKKLWGNGIDGRPVYLHDLLLRGQASNVRIILHDSFHLLLSAAASHLLILACEYHVGHSWLAEDEIN
jgi:hypothetical protein